MSGCAGHRQYLGAIADGETHLVPPETLAHVATCPDCGPEVEAHRLTGRRLRAAVAQLSDPPAGRVRGRLLSAAAAAAVLVLMFAGTAVWRYTAGEDRVAAAAAVAGQSPQYWSGDSQEIASWCVRASRRPMPEVALDSLRPVGARMDRRDGLDIVSVSYEAPAGGAVIVAWLDANRVPAERASVSARQVGGRTALLVASPAGTAVVLGSASPADLMETAREIQRAGRAGGTSAPVPVVVP